MPEKYSKDARMNSEQKSMITPIQVMSKMGKAFVNQYDFDMSSMGYKPKTGPKWTQKEYIPKQRKYKYFTSLKL
jgi:hypothetical protein